MTFYISKLKLISLITTVTIILLFSFDQASWAAIIICPIGAAVCNGTSADDIIEGTTGNAQIHGLGGNDYIYGYRDGDNYIFREDGNDILIGGIYNDGLYGGKGDDKYDGQDSSDTIIEDRPGSKYTTSNDVISGGLGGDWIEAGGGADTINGGPDNDYIIPNPFHRDFSYDFVDCGSGIDHVLDFNSGDRETATYCEYISNNDG